MRSFINLIEHNHPHARGEDEYFKFLYVYQMNVDEARRLIKSNSITTEQDTYPLKMFAERALGAKESQFGSNNYDSKGPVSLFGPPVDYKQVPTIPRDRVYENPLCVYWNFVDMAELLGEDTSGLNPGSSLSVIDGNHRIMRRYIEGDTGDITIDVVVAAKDIAQFTYKNGERLADLIKG